MALEVERKFLAKNCFDYDKMAREVRVIRQGYLSDNPERTVRIRVADRKAYLTVKSKNRGCVRCEWEYEIPVNDAEEMLALPGVKILSKRRYVIPYGGKDWEVDVFEGALAGLVIAEVELGDPDESIEIPPFVDTEVTGDPRYYNSSLLRSL